MKMEQFGLHDAKLFHFHRIFAKGGGGGRGGGSSEPPEPPLDTPLAAELSLIFVQHFDCFMVCSIVLIWRISTTISGRNV